MPIRGVVEGRRVAHEAQLEAADVSEVMLRRIVRLSDPGGSYATVNATLVRVRRSPRPARHHIPGRRAVRVVGVPDREERRVLLQYGNAPAVLRLTTPPEVAHLRT